MQKQDVQPPASKGLATFNDIEDSALRNNNRANVMANLFEDNAKKDFKGVTAKGAAMVLSYFAGIPDVDKKDTYKAYQQVMSSRGFVEATNAG